MDDRRGTRVFAMVLLLIGAVSAATVTSCGGGGSDGESNGALCEQCGDTDGPCQTSVETSGDDRPSGCTGDPCTVQLRCTRKVDSGQRRCFPVDPSSNQLDFRYECDGSRPIESFAPTVTPSATPTFTPEATVTPTSTEPTATGSTPTATATAPTPSATATPAGAEDVAVTITIDDPDFNDLPTTFSAAVTYPLNKGKFTQGGMVECETDDGLTASDAGTGTLTIAFSGDTDGISDVSLTCTFHQVAGEVLTNGDLGATVNPATLNITIDDL